MCRSSGDTAICWPRSASSPSGGSMAVDDRAITGAGVEYIVDVYGWDPDLWRSGERLNTIVTRLIREVGVRPIRGPLWQMFPAPGGITGLRLLAESNPGGHSYPETRVGGIRLY